jgi:hypothetical protein
MGRLRQRGQLTVHPLSQCILSHSASSSALTLHASSNHRPVHHEVASEDEGGQLMGQLSSHAACIVSSPAGAS